MHEIWWLEKSQFLKTTNFEWTTVLKDPTIDLQQWSGNLSKIDAQSIVISTMLQLSRPSALWAASADVILASFSFI